MLNSTRCCPPFSTKLSRKSYDAGRMYKVTKHIDFCYGHRLLNYNGQCRHLHGHNGRVEAGVQANKLKVTTVWPVV
jgi:hypothetical protein